ncbi:MAG: diaminopimelate epimerase [Acidimicrobiaceae bacterium]|nr:diaminopimelate epimerase [Acidimicrobiaceae bacterium]
MQVVVTKHHGLGNDFLVLETSQISQQIMQSANFDWANMAREWCNRETGVGADGLLLLSRTGKLKLGMQLFNQDGSRAEMSGNGIRCLAQAAFDTDGFDEQVSYTVATDVGDRVVDVESVSSDEVSASVDMGRIEIIPEPKNWGSIGCDPIRPVMHLSVGNPHSVVGVEDVFVVDLLDIGLKVPQINLEIIESGPEPDAITMRVHERGAGITQACGTGACASAWAAVKWGLVPSSVREVLVHQPGGDSRVRLDHPQIGHVTLIGPAHFESRHLLEVAL